MSAERDELEEAQARLKDLEANPITDEQRAIFERLRATTDGAASTSSAADGSRSTR